MSDSEAEQISSSDGESGTEDGRISEKSDKSEAKKCKRDAEELEDGEITDSDEDDEPTKTSNSEHPRIVALPSDDDLEVMDMKPLIRVVNPNENVTNSGICKFFARGNCTWGDNCKYKHSKDQRGNRFNNGSHSMFMSNQQPVPLNSLNTFLPQTAWDQAISVSKRRSTSKPSKMSSSSSSPKNSEDGDSCSRKIPSLLDLSPSSSRHSRRDSAQRDRKYSSRHSSDSPDDSYRRKQNSESTRFSSTCESRNDYNKGSYNRKSSRERSPGKRRKLVQPSPDRSNRKYDRNSSRRSSPRRKRSTRSDSGSPIGFRPKNPTRQQIDDYFAERDEEKPAAYRMDDRKLSVSPRKRARRHSSSSSSSSFSSSSSSSNSSSASSISSAGSKKDTKKSSKVEVISDSDSAKKDECLKPQQITSSEDDEISSDEKNRLKRTNKKRERNDSSSDSDDENYKRTSHKRKRPNKIKSNSPQSVSDSESEQHKNGNSVLDMDIDEVLDQYENRSDNSPLNVS